MDVLDAAYITEQNKIASSGAWIWLLEITTTGYGTPLRFTNNNSNITWPASGGDLYYATSFSMDDLSVSTSGKFPTYKLQVSAVDLDNNMRTRIKATAGLVGSTVRLRIVHSDHLDLTAAAVDEIAEILSCELTASAVVFTIGIPSLLSKRFPRDRYVPAFCRHKFGGALCQYAQPSASLTSSQISFIVGTDYNTIWLASGTLITGLFDQLDGQLIAPNNLIVNGSFEDKEVNTSWYRSRGISDWDIAGGTPSGTYRNWEDSISKVGSLCYHHEAPNIHGVGISQIVPVETGVEYVLSCWVYNRDATGIGYTKLRATLQEGDPSDYVASTISNAWELLQLPPFTIDAALGGQLRVFVGGYGDAFFDAVSLVRSSEVANYDRYALTRDEGFTISGSASNDGLFIANNYYAVDDQYVRVFTEADGVKAFVTEGAGEAITLTLGYDVCDHTLEACAVRNNTQNFGGSPGIAGGIYA